MRPTCSHPPVPHTHLIEAHGVDFEAEITQHDVTDVRRRQLHERSLWQALGLKHAQTRHDQHPQECEHGVDLGQRKGEVEAIGLEDRLVCEHDATAIEVVQGGGMRMDERGC